MIINLLINVVLLIVGAILDVFHLTRVTALPTIGGFNIDSALVSGIAEMRTFFIAFWPLQDMFFGFLAIMGYFSLKLVLTFVLGHRAPGQHS